MSLAGRSQVLVAGFGCQRGCSASELGALLDRTLLQYRLQRSALTGLASIDLKCQEPGLLALAEQLGLPLVFFSSAELARFEPQLNHRSTLAHRHTGCFGIAESCALALAEQLGGCSAELKAPRCTSARATLALAAPRQNIR
ncbi:cobalamin biosynthesis protein [Pseudomonas sp. LS1212]|uniref:cobalamin biosynthesis protein n=1 Tax=Pseudomonas sp. LS1212 TaxID=2972478 RepID=UPI00215C4AC8|nr:cobalamin biosynthesis protein [Pseudomonas sp. LS1212]UVJ45868.1 cobalamin biosynthesis protein [Pseudomonas sp. LS1212]